MRTTNLGVTWRQHGSPASIPWQPAMGDTSDGPGEPSLARLPDGRLLCVFRSDSMAYYWAARSADDGATWSAAAPLRSGGQPFAWSVKPRLRLTSGGVLVLAGGRPGIDLWASADGGESWSRWNLAAIHNARVGALGANYSYDSQV